MRRISCLRFNFAEFSLFPSNLGPIFHLFKLLISTPNFICSAAVRRPPTSLYQVYIFYSCTYTPRSIRANRLYTHHTASIHSFIYLLTSRMHSSFGHQWPFLVPLSRTFLLLTPIFRSAPVDLSTFLLSVKSPRSCPISYQISCVSSDSYSRLSPKSSLRRKQLTSVSATSSADDSSYASIRLIRSFSHIHA